MDLFVNFKSKSMQHSPAKKPKATSAKQTQEILPKKPSFKFLPLSFLMVEQNVFFSFIDFRNALLIKDLNYDQLNHSEYFVIFFWCMMIDGSYVCEKIEIITLPDTYLDQIFFDQVTNTNNTVDVETFKTHEQI